MGSIIKYFSLFLLIWIIACCNSDQGTDNNRKTSSFEKHVKYHENGSIRVMYFTDKNNEIVNPIVNFDSLGGLKDSTWIDDEEVWEYQKLYSNGKLTAILDNYIYDDYLNMKYIKIDKYGDTAFHKSEYCEIYSLGDTVTLDEGFLFNLL